jgi:uncharacterized membrane protein
MATITAPAQTNRIRDFQQRRAGRQARPTNVGDGERWLSLLGGGALALLGLSRGSLGGLGLALLGGGLCYRGATGHCDVYSALGFNTAEPHAAHTSIPAGRGVRVDASTTINRPAQDLFRYWRDFENLPRFMHNLESVRSTGGNRSHWVARGPMGVRVEWDAEVITERPNELIGWRSLPGSQVDTAGSVHFTPAPGNRGTEVKVEMKYDPPGGKAGATLAWLLGDSPAAEVREDLRRFKRLLETGEIPTTRGQPSGRPWGRDEWQQTGPMVLDDRFAWGLGAFSIGLGLALLAAPEAVSEAVGVGDHALLVRLIGLRELACGAGIFARGTQPRGWVWARVAGDAMDLTLLAAALTSPNADTARVAAAKLAVLGVTAADLLCALRLSRDPHDVAGTPPAGRVLGPAPGAGAGAVPAAR